MSEPLKTCHCGAQFTESQSSGRNCFRCKMSTVGFTWRGPTRASKQNFHDFTTREVIEDSIRHEKANGTHGDMEFVGGKFF